MVNNLINFRNIVSHENENNLILAESGGNMNWIAYQRFATVNKKYISNRSILFVLAH